MEQAMQEATSTVVKLVIYAVLFMAALTILKFILERFKSSKQMGLAGERRRGKRDRNYSEELMDSGDAYIARTHLMTPTERDVFKVLEKAYGDKYYIFCQVRVVDIIQPNTRKYHAKSKEHMSLFRQLSQWHFDYVLCYKEDFKVFCALELDDRTHESPERVKRDRILDSACKIAGLKIERAIVNHKSRSVDLKVKGG